MIIDTTKVKRFDWFDDRFYPIVTPDGTTEFYPSSTNILSAYPKPNLTKWRGDVGNQEADRIMREAAERGTRIHNACETLTAGGEVIFIPPYTPDFDERRLKDEAAERTNGNYFPVYRQEEMWQIERFSLFLEAFKPETVAQEMTVFSHEYKYAGTLDFLFRIDAGTYPVSGRDTATFESGLYIADLKTGKEISESHFLQIASYDYALREGTDFDIKGSFIIHTNAQIRTGIEGLKIILRTREQQLSDFMDFDTTRRLWLRDNAKQKPKARTIPSILTYQKEPK